MEEDVYSEALGRSRHGRNHRGVKSEQFSWSNVFHSEVMGVLIRVRVLASRQVDVHFQVRAHLKHGFPFVLATVKTEPFGSSDRVVDLLALLQRVAGQAAVSSFEVDAGTVTLAFKACPIVVAVIHEVTHVFLNITFAWIVARESRLVTRPIDLEDEVVEHLLARLVVVSGNEVSCFGDRQPGQISELSDLSAHFQDLVLRHAFLLILIPVNLARLAPETFVDLVRQLEPL